MSDFLDGLNNATKTPEEARKEKENIKTQNDIKEKEFIDECVKFCANEHVERIKNDALRKASEGEYLENSGYKLITGTVELMLNFNDEEKYDKVSKFYPVNHAIPIQDQKDMHYVSWKHWRQNLKYKQGKAIFVSALEHSRIDKYGLTDLAQKIIDEIKESLKKENIKTGIRFIVKTREKEIISEECFDNMEEITVKEGFNKQVVVSSYIYYEIKY